MKPTGRLVSAMIFLFAFSCLVQAADLNFPYASFRLRLAPHDDPFPGLGNYYTTIAKGEKSVLWNPASLAKLQLSEASLALPMVSGLYSYEKSFKVTESGGKIEFDPGSIGNGGNYGLFYRYPSDIGSGLTTREITVIGHSSYATETTGQNFSSALKVNNWVTVGFSSNSPIGADLSLAGAFPVTARAQINFIGQKLGDMTIGADGKLRFEFGGIVYTSEAAVWSSFLSQEATLPLIAFSELRNNMTCQSPYTASIASKIGNFSLGLNMVPISANANIDNDIRAVVDADTSNIYLYTPNFDPTNQADILNWTTTEARYGTSNGYTRKDIKVPAGDVVGTAKYRGFYQASTTRFDLGGMYDVTDWLTVGLVLENLTGSTLNFKGNGLATFISYRGISTDESANFDDLMKPGGKTEYNLVSDRWTTTSEAGGTLLYLEPEKNYELPKRLRYGLALTRPWLIAIDFEQNSSPITIRQVQNNVVSDVVIRDLSFIRIGLETQLLFLPMWLRGGLTLMPKPTISGLTAEAQKSIDDAYSKVSKFGLPGFPVKFDLGTNLNAWGTLVGLSFGLNAQSLISVLQFDTTNIDLSKVLFSNLTIGRDAWLISYIMQIDPLATAAAYGSKPAVAGTGKKFEASDAKFIQTLGVTYRF